MRITRDQYYSSMAILASLRSTCLRAKVGAVLVKNRRIISSGYGGSPPGQLHCLDAGCILDPATGGCIRTLHAEANAILFAAQQGIPTKDSELYTTLSPCLSCAKLIVSAGIKSIHYLAEYRDSTGLDFLNQCGIETIKGEKENVILLLQEELQGIGS